MEQDMTIAEKDALPPQKISRTLNQYGEPSDKKPILAGDTFTTLTGRQTTPFPKQKSEKYASRWTIDNAVAEALARGDKFNLLQFENTTILKNGELSVADVASMHLYMFHHQPPVVRSIFK